MACTQGNSINVRALVHELGAKIGCGAHLASLRRTVSGKFDVKDAVPFEDILRYSPVEMEKRVLPFLQLTQSE